MNFSPRYTYEMTLQEEAQLYKTKADKLLNDSNLLEVLKKYGEVRFEGSYAAGLMMSGDIDLQVVKENGFTTEESFEVFRDIFFSTNPFFRSYYVKSDWADPRLGHQYPIGHYLGMRTKVDDEVWKIDLWLVSTSEWKKRESEDKLNIAKTELTIEQRERILEFKKYRKEHNLAIGGQAIYEAVLQGITNPQHLI